MECFVVFTASIQHVVVLFATGCHSFFVFFFVFFFFFVISSHFLGKKFHSHILCSIVGFGFPGGVTPIDSIVTAAMEHGQPVC